MSPPAPTDSSSLESDDILHGPVIVLDLALSLRVLGNAAGDSHLALIEVILQYIRNVGGRGKKQRGDSAPAPVRYQIPSGEESGTVRAAGPESSRRFLPHVAMVKTTDTWQSGNFRAG